MVLTNCGVGSIRFFIVAVPGEAVFAITIQVQETGIEGAACQILQLGLFSKGTSEIEGQLYRSFQPVYISEITYAL